MPFADDEIRCDLACGIGTDGHWHGWYDIQVRAGSLWRLGLHPDQPTSAISLDSWPK